jgi:tripartite-type tricarboxylate transporter receptor subunit TctC
MKALKLLAGIGATAVFAAGAAAQTKAETDYPGKLVRIVVGYGAGGGTDSVGRLFAQRFTETLGQQFIVENRPGAGGNIAAEYVAKSNDPYKLLFGAGAHVINASLYSSIPYDPIKDFTPIGLIAIAPNVLVAKPSLGVKNLRELIALAKAKPGEISYASPGSGTPMHLAMELFASMAGIKLVHVPYNGGGTAVAAALGGQTDLLTMSLPTVLPHVKSGKLVALGVTSRTRSVLVPDMPTVEEAAGLPGYEAIAWYGLLAPATMPPGSVQKLNTAIQHELDNPDVKQKLIAQGFEPARTTPAEFRQFLIDDMDKWAKVVKASGAKAD